MQAVPFIPQLANTIYLIPLDEQWLHQQHKRTPRCYTAPRLYKKKRCRVCRGLCVPFMSLFFTNFVSILPFEISGRIFSFLPQRDRIECTRVCRLWRDGIFLWDSETWSLLNFWLNDIPLTMPFLKKIALYIKDLHAKHNGYDHDENEPFLVDPTHLEMLTSLPLPQLRTLSKEKYMHFVISLSFTNVYSLQDTSVGVYSLQY